LSILFEEINNLLNVKLPINVRKICDLKPAYGEIFKEEIEKYDFWGFADLDIIWGNIESFIDDNKLNKFDIITSRKKNIAGHFTLLRNTNKINKLYKKIPDYKKIFKKEKFQWFDEFYFNNYIKDNIKDIKIYWEKNLLNVEKNIDSQQDYHLDRWSWNFGGLNNNKSGEEIMYLHFINWKKYLKFNEVQFNKNVDSFLISYNKIHFKKHSKIQIFFNKIKNFFFGFWIRIFLKNKLKTFKRRLNHYICIINNVF
tara:strand:- start:3644 stop:4408 length:765 start_codon:yes stop_codon:yes gene_type:complete